MGTLNWTVTNYSTGGNKNIQSTKHGLTGAFTSSTSAAPVTNAVFHPGQVVTVSASEEMWIDFGGRTAAVGTGHYLPANFPMSYEVEVGDAGAMSAIDVA